MDLWVAVISGAALIIVAVINGIALRERKKEQKARESEEKRAELRAKESRLTMAMLDASIELGLATAIAVEEHKLNGEMKRAKEKAVLAQTGYTEFIQNAAAHEMAKR